MVCHLLIHFPHFCCFKASFFADDSKLPNDSIFLGNLLRYWKEKEIEDTSRKVQLNPKTHPSSLQKSKRTYGYQRLLLRKMDEMHSDSYKILINLKNKISLNFLNLFTYFHTLYSLYDTCIFVLIWLTLVYINQSINQWNICIQRYLYSLKKYKSGNDKKLI